MVFIESRAKKITQKVELVNMFLRISLGTQTSTGIVINECIGIRLYKFLINLANVRSPEQI